MIVIPTAPEVHVVFDGIAWASGMALSAVLYRWRLRGAVARVAARTGPGYFTSLAAGAALGAWAAGSLNTLRDEAPVLSHSIAGALAGAIIAVEGYKAVRGIRGSTGGIFVGSFSLGVAVGRWGCLFAGLPDRTYGTPTGLPWGVDLGDGIPRHPVQVYEFAGNGGLPGHLLAGPAPAQPLGGPAQLLRHVRLLWPATLRLGVPEALSRADRAA